ncbi:MAG: HTTM domain-containing protein [Myxococcaceae bacterium]|nr:HTTM domain-containing protein [Myxococcaceae bacterium]
MARLEVPVDAAGLAAFRMCFGLLTFVSMVRPLLHGWVTDFFVRPTFFFKYWGFSWVEAWPAWGMYAHHGVLAVLSLFVAAGLFYRVSIFLFFVGFTWLQLVDVTNYLNHYYLVSLLALLLNVVPAHRAWSLDAMRRPELRTETLPAKYTYLLRFQVGVVYFFAGLAKLNADWLLHAQPLGIWLSSRTDTPVVGPLFALPWVWLAMSWSGFLFDTTIVAFLLIGRTRRFAYPVVIAFHAMTWLLFPIGMFPFIMVVSALVFFPPEWPRRVAGWMARLPGNPVRVLPGGRGVQAPRTSTPGWALVLAAAYCALQLLMPLRAHLYGGDVRWHEQGMRFSWRVMVREKNGSITFRVRPRGSDSEWQVSPTHYLTNHQAREMSGQPDLILQLAKHIARDFQARGLGDVEVRVDALVSLNGRPSAHLIDPNVDLTTVEDGLLPASWTLPLPPSPPVKLKGSA